MGVGKAEELATQDCQLAGHDFRERLVAWLELLAVIQRVARACEAEGYPLGGAGELDGAVDDMRAILQEINESWPQQEPAAALVLSYEELRSFADCFPPPHNGTR